MTLTEGDPCPKCGTPVKDLDVDSEKMKTYCPNCAPDLVINSPAAEGEKKSDEEKVWTSYDG